MRRARGTGRATRLSLALQVGTMTALVGVLAVLAIEVSGWRPLSARLDLTASASNSLDPATVELLEKLPEAVTIDTFFHVDRALPSAAAIEQARSRMLDLLSTASESVPDRVELRTHDLTRDLDLVRQRMQELGVDETQTMVISLGDRRSVLRLDPEIASFEQTPAGPGTPPSVRLAAFHGEEALIRGLAQVGERPKVYFSSGHGERDPLDTDPARGLAALWNLLRNEGFECARWEPSRDGAVPHDTDLLLVPGPEKPFTESALEAIEAYMERRGRLLVSSGGPLLEGPGSVAELIRPFGMELVPGIVCEAVLGIGGLHEGSPVCAQLLVDERGMSTAHPITAPLARRRERLAVSFTRSFDRGRAPEGGVLLDLLSSSAEAWRDLPGGVDGRLNFALDQGREEWGRFSLAMVARFPLEGAAAGDGAAEESGEAGALVAEPPEARVLALGTTHVFDDQYLQRNRDFVRNAFNWLVEREYRIRVSPREVTESFVDVRRGTALTRFSQIAWWGLPGLCLLAGVVLYFRRRS